MPGGGRHKYRGGPGIWVSSPLGVAGITASRCRGGGLARRELAFRPELRLRRSDRQPQVAGGSGNSSCVIYPRQSDVDSAQPTFYNEFLPSRGSC